MGKYYKIEVNYPKGNTWEGWKEYFNYENKFFSLEQAEDMIEHLKSHFRSYAVFDQPELRIIEYTTRIIKTNG